MVGLVFPVYFVWGAVLLRFLYLIVLLLFLFYNFKFEFSTLSLIPHEIEYEILIAFSNIFPWTTQRNELNLSQDGYLINILIHYTIV